MTKINDLISTDTLNDSDVFLVSKYSTGYTNKITLFNFKKWLLANVFGVQKDITEYLDIPNTGFVRALPNNTVNMTDNLHLIITPTGTLATGTVTFPLSPVDKQTISITTTATITALTLNGNGKTIAGAVTTLSANAFVRYKFDSITNKWYRYG